MKNFHPTAPLPAHLKSFARTLHFHSPAAYAFVRKTFLKCLPCVESLNRWESSSNYKPGISTEIIHFLSKKVKEESEKRNKKLFFNLTFDDMSIKKWLRYNKKTKEWEGLVDLGGQLQNDENKDDPKKANLASKAFVFMTTCGNAAFKTPVAHYLHDGLTGEEKSILLKDLLIEFAANNIVVYSVTFDGEGSNLTACKLLGANFDYHSDKFKPYFLHPVTSRIIYCFFDACHMLKLVRNYFAEKGSIYSNGTDKID